MSTNTTSAVRLNAATLSQYLASQSSLVPGKRRAVLLRAAPSWDGPGQLTWGGEQRLASVAAAPSPLAVHELVLNHQATSATGPDVLVVLTDHEEADLGPDLIAKVHKQRVNTVEAWDVVREAFSASDTDPRLSDENWAAEALLDATPPGGWPKLPGGGLRRREALVALALRRLGIGRYDPDRDVGTPSGDGDVLDVPTLLRWSLTPGGPDRLLALRAPERAGLVRFIGEDEQCGLAGQALLALVDAEHGPDAVAFGLVCAALWGHADEAADAENYRARGRAERWFGEEPPAHGAVLDALLAAFGRSCEEFVSGLLLTGRSELDEASASARRLTGITLDRATVLARQFGAEAAARTSPVLAAGIEARFAAVGQALLDGDVEGAARSLATLAEHRLAPDTDQRARIERARMALRLSRWVASGPATGSGTVGDGVRRHIAETGWADLALEHLESGGDPDPTLRASYARLCTSVRALRREIDREFARTLATVASGGGSSEAMLTVEEFLPAVVAPVVKGRDHRVLLVVLGGMSAAIAAELSEELREHWAEYDPLPKAQDSPRRRGMAAALPTVTSVSRTSLFSARLRESAQADEKKLFPAHPFWGGEDVAVFHSEDLPDERAGAPIGPALREALEADRTHVAVVLNSVHDRLVEDQKPGECVRQLDDLGKLRELLRFAAAQGRTVILTSDHGHVVDRHGVQIEAEGALSARHRTPDGALAEAEVLLSGPRVVAPGQGGEIVALWDADSRYASQKAGHGGGVALAEFAVPVLAFLPFGAEPPRDWRELGSQQPLWWSAAQESAEQMLSARPPGAVAPATSRKSSKRAREEAQYAQKHDSLFEVSLVPSEGDALLAAVPAPSHDAEVSALLASDVFAAQVHLLARKPDLPRVEKAVRALLDAGGTLPVSALGQRVGRDGPRAAGFAAVLRQLLNHDSVQVLETLPDGRTLRLNRSLLREQFNLR